MLKAQLLIRNSSDFTTTGKAKARQAVADAFKTWDLDALTKTMRSYWLDNTQSLWSVLNKNHSIKNSKTFSEYKGKFQHLDGKSSLKEISDTLWMEYDDLIKKFKKFQL